MSSPPPPRAPPSRPNASDASRQPPRIHRTDSGASQSETQALPAKPTHKLLPPRPLVRSNTVGSASTSRPPPPVAARPRPTPPIRKQSRAAPPTPPGQRTKPHQPPPPRPTPVHRENPSRPSPNRRMRRSRSFTGGAPLQLEAFSTDDEDGEEEEEDERRNHRQRNIVVSRQPPSDGPRTPGPSRMHPRKPMPRGRGSGIMLRRRGGNRGGGGSAIQIRAPPGDLGSRRGRGGRGGAQLRGGGLSASSGLVAGSRRGTDAGEIQRGHSASHGGRGRGRGRGRGSRLAWHPKRPNKPLPPPPPQPEISRAKHRLSQPPKKRMSVRGSSGGGKRKDKRTYIAEEILSTEVSYVESLSGVLQYFRKPLSAVLSPEEDRIMFSNVHILVNFHSHLRSELEARMERWESSPTIGDVLVQAVPFMKMYTSYVNNYGAVTDLLSSLLRNNSKFASALDQCAYGNMEGELGLSSLLMSPIQRIPRYVLLFRSLLEHTSAEHADYEPLTKAYNAVSDMANTINERKRADEQRFRMRTVIGTLSKECLKKMQRACGDDLESFEALKPDRILLKEGPALHTRVMTDKDGVSTNKFGRQIKDKRPCVLFLFNEALLALYTKKLTEEEILSKEELTFEFAALIPYYSKALGFFPKVQPVGTRAFSVMPPRATEIHTFHWSEDARAKEWFELLTGAIESLEQNMRVRKGSVAGDQPTRAVPQDKAWDKRNSCGIVERFFIPNTTPVPGGGGKLFTAYVIEERSPNGEVIRTILKRYNQFHALNSKLKKTRGVRKKKLPYLPKKKIFGNMDTKFLKKRRRKLTNYLNNLPPEAMATAVVRNFLNTGVEADITDEELENAGNSSSEDEVENTTLSQAKWANVSEAVPAEAASGVSESASLVDNGAEKVHAEEKVEEDGEEEFIDYEVASVLHDFTAQATTELSIQAGEQLYVLSRDDPSWWFCVKADGSSEGYVPESFVLLEARR